MDFFEVEVMTLTGPVRRSDSVDCSTITIETLREFRAIQ